MNSRALLRTSRVIRPSTRCLVLRTPMQQRFASSEQQPSHLSQFYKTFTRPVAKVLLMAVFTYQLAYWAWAKLETDEIMAEREAYIGELEDEVARLSAPEPPGLEKIQELQMQLMMLEERNKKVLAEREKLKGQEMKGQEMKGQEMKGQETSGQKTSPWWKVW